MELESGIHVTWIIKASAASHVTNYESVSKRLFNSRSTHKDFEESLKFVVSLICHIYDDAVANEVDSVSSAPSGNSSENNHVNGGHLRSTTASSSLPNCNGSSSIRESCTNVAASH